jgi:hypothetical protein
MPERPDSAHEGTPGDGATDAHSDVLAGKYFLVQSLTCGDLLGVPDSCRDWPDARQATQPVK